MIEVLGTDEFDDWFQELDEQASEAVVRAVGLLEARGVTLGHPQSTAILGSRYPLRELRAQAGGRPLRVLYAFDPLRRALLLLGGDKTSDDDWYERNVPRAERLWEDYLRK